MPPSKNICFDELAKYFHLPINQVAKELGVCATILKKICRRNGIPRWPHRKIKSLDKMIANLEVNLSKNPNEREEINHEVELLRKKKTEIMKNPNILVSKNSRNHSKQGLSATMKKTKEQKQQNEVYTVNNFKAKELSLGDEEYSSDDSNNCWSNTISTSPTIIKQPISNGDKKHQDSIITSQIFSSRRPSLPTLDLQRMISLPNHTAINLPPLGRRHSMGSLPPRMVASSFTLSGSPAYHLTPTIDLSQKLPAFQFDQNIPTISLPCIEPSMNGSNKFPLIEDSSKNTIPEWFIEEKNRVFGYEENKTQK